MKKQEHIHYWTKSSEMENGVKEYYWFCYNCLTKVYGDPHRPSALDLAKHAEREAKQFENN